MMCDALINNNDDFRMGCNNNNSNSISITFADNRSDISVRKFGFFDNFRKNSLKKSKENSWTNIFGKKSANNNNNSQEESKKKDEDMAKLIEQLELEGRSENEISMHLSYIQDIHVVPSSPKEKSSSPPTIVSWFKEMHQSIKEEFGFAKPSDMYYYPPSPSSSPQFESDLQGLTVSLSSAPFYGAYPTELDLSYEELSSLEPVYVGSKCINLLPTSTHDGSTLPGDQSNCSVCLCEFAKGEELKSLPCVHFFHSECIDRWLLVGHTCPVCKRLVE